MIIKCIVAAILLIMAIIILLGKGDMLMAGYNTASKREREKVDVRKLRLITSILLIILIPFCLLANEHTSKSWPNGLDAVILVVTITAIALANTWARKK